MSNGEEKRNEKGELIDDESKVIEEKPTKPNVELTQEQYGALLDKVAELEQVALQPKKEVYTLDELTQEVERGRKEETPPSTEDVDGMGNAQLADHIVSRVIEEGQKQINVLDAKIETIRVLREVDKAEAKHEDFWEHQEAIHKIARENPTLSIEQAYKMAKLEKEERGEKKGPIPSDDRTILHTLPPRAPVPSGEKPGVVPASTTTTTVKTTQEAAEKAWEEVQGGKKE